MARVLIIDAPKKNYIKSVFFGAVLVVFGLLFFAAVSFVVLGLSDVFFFAIFAYVVFTLLVLYRPVRIILRSFRIRSFASLLTVSGNAVYVSRPYAAEYGFFTAVMRADGVHRSFTVQSAGTFSQHPLLSEAHLIVADSDGNGKIVLPGYRIDEGKYRGVLVLFFVPGYSVDFQRDHLSVESVMDRADLFVRPTDMGFSGFLRYTFNREALADVWLSWVGSEVAVRLSVSGEKDSFRYPLIAEPIIIVSSEELLEPSVVAEALGVSPIVQGTGSFVLTLRLRVPMESDVVDSSYVWIAPRV